jgi:hypothetical protein
MGGQTWGQKKKGKGNGQILESTVRVYFRALPCAAHTFRLGLGLGLVRAAFWVLGIQHKMYGTRTSGTLHIKRHSDFPSYLSALTLKCFSPALLGSGLYVPICSRNFPSRGARESAATASVLKQQHEAAFFDCVLIGRKKPMRENPAGYKRISGNGAEVPQNLILNGHLRSVLTYPVNWLVYAAESREA